MPSTVCGEPAQRTIDERDGHNRLRRLLRTQDFLYVASQNQHYVNSQTGTRNSRAALPVSQAMRALAMVLMTVPAAADPQLAKPDVKLPAIVKEATENIRVIERESVLNMDGTVSAAIVVKPGYHPDAEPVSKGGSWIVPPDPNDPMAIEPGTNQLRSRERVEAWLPRDLSRRLKLGADKVWDFVLPKL